MIEVESGDFSNEVHKASLVKAGLLGAGILFA